MYAIKNFNIIDTKFGKSLTVEACKLDENAEYFKVLLPSRLLKVLGEADSIEHLSFFKYMVYLGRDENKRNAAQLKFYETTDEIQPINVHSSQQIN